MQPLEKIIASLNKCDNLSEVARKAGLTRAYVSAIAKGKHMNPRYETLVKLNEALKGAK